MKILLIDQPLWNRGDESAHKGLIRNIIKAVPNADIKVMEIDVKQEAINEFDMHLPQVQFVNLHSKNKKWFGRFFYHAYKYHIGWLLLWTSTGRKIKKIYEEADVIIMAPGGINLGGFQDWKHLSLLLIARKMNKKLVYYGRSIGPFGVGVWQQRRFLSLARKVLSYCSFVCLRDSKSIRVAKDLNIKCTPTLDSAFLDSPSAEIPAAIKQMTGKDKYIVFVPNELIWHYEFKGIPADTINGFYRRLVEKMQAHYPNHKIVMLPQTNHQKRNDFVYFCELKDQCKADEHIVIIPDTYSSDVQQAIIHNADLMVGSRYHSIVFAINQGIPFVSLSYEHKMSGLLESLDCTDRMIDLKGVFDTPSAMGEAVKRFDFLITNPSDSKEAQKKAKMIATECFKTFISSLSY